MMSPTSPEPQSPRTALKHHLLVMVVAIVILDAIAIPVFYLLHLNRQPGNPQTTYVGVWMFLSAIIVAVQYRKIRRARLEIIRGKTVSGGGR
jgi:hypothetical protein